MIIGLIIALGCAILATVCVIIRRGRAQVATVSPVPGPRPISPYHTRDPQEEPAPAEEDRAEILDSYPVLAKVPYDVPPGGMYPLSYITIADGTRKRIVDRIGRLTFSTPSLNLLSLLEDPESNAREVASLVSTNPAFSGKVLQTVNSAYFNQAEKVTSIGRAITLLGFNNVRTLVLDDVLTATGSQGTRRPDHVRLWMHSAMVSACAGYIGKSLFHISEYTLGTIGLLHDIGKYFLPVFPGQEEPVDDVPSIIREDRRFDVNHAIIGSMIANAWRLPRVIGDTIEHHHSPSFFPPAEIPETVLKAATVVCLADLICHVMDNPAEGRRYTPLRKEYYDAFGLSESLLDIVTPALIREMEKAALTVRSYMDAQ